MEIKPPFLVSYSITTKCNLACKHCYSEATEERAPDELSTEEAFKLIDDLAGWGIGLLVLDGGEPLLRDDFLEIISYASKKGIMTGVGSNGIPIDEKMARKMEEAGVQSVSISIDGANAETHDSFRGKTGAFHQALEGVSALREAGLPFQLNMVIRKGTLSQIPDMLKLAVESGANAAEFFDLVEAGRAKKECPDEVLEPEERKAIMEWLAEAQIDCPILIRVPACPMYPLILKERGVQPKHFPMEMLRRVPYYGRGCAAGMPLGYIVVRANGEVNPCMLLQVKLGNVRERSITQIWQESEILAQLRRRELLKGKCGECKYRVECTGCRGRAYERTGDMFAADSACWL
jgi:radical SAM protein with 4Fe4S-binding SPASM domain